MCSRKAQNTNVSLWFESIIYHIRGKHAIHYTMEAADSTSRENLLQKKYYLLILVDLYLCFPCQWSVHNKNPFFQSKELILVKQEYCITGYFCSFGLKFLFCGFLTSKQLACITGSNKLFFQHIIFWYFNFCVLELTAEIR